MNLSIFNKIAKSQKLQYFLEKSFSLELLLLLYNQNEFEGIENIYQVLVSPKPKYPAFKSYLIYLNNKNCINIDDGKIKKSSKTISLKSTVFLEFDAIIKFYEKNILSNNK
tara:strand:+ start:152 stop:484 length:333 start_codon:yes stop_codon:yes gene_type:complete